MQRRSYVRGVAALLAALLAGCTGGGGRGGEADDFKPGEAGAAPPRPPSRASTARSPSPAARSTRGTLDSTLPGIAEIAGRGAAGEGVRGRAPPVTYDMDRHVGCRWKVESSRRHASSPRRLRAGRVDDTAVSDDTRATEVYASKVQKADLPAPLLAVRRPMRDADAAMPMPMPMPSLRAAPAADQVNPTSRATRARARAD